MTDLVISFFDTIYTTVLGLFQYDHTTRGTSVEFWVVLTTLLLLSKFAAGSLGPLLFSKRSMGSIVQVMLLLEYTSLHYTLGLMEPSSQEGGTLDGFFQVWAVLIVTMQYSVQVGQPYKEKELSLVDLLSSLWSADLLRRSTTPVHLRLPLWSIWSLNSWRIIRYYIDSKRECEASVENMKLVGDYMMRSQHASDDADTTTMKGYRYLVHGEERQEMKIQRSGTEGDNSFTVALHETRPEELITVEKVWSLPDSNDQLLSMGADSDNRFKDVCLSFALYKLLRRRFFNLPVPEEDTASRKLVFDAILEDTKDCQRAFRVTEIELSFLHDFSHSKHAVVFAGGFPVQKLVLSLLMLGLLSYLAYAVRDLPRAIHLVYIPTASAPVADDKNQILISRSRITHGVFVTRCIVAIIVCREIWDIVIYVFSQWTKLLIICRYLKLENGRQKRLMEKVAKIMFRGISRGHWDQKIRQYNLLLSAHAESQACCGWLPRRSPPMVKLHVEVKKALLVSLKALNKKKPVGAEQDRRLGSYLQRAFHHDSIEGQDPLAAELKDLLAELKGETHKVLVWHVATCLCQIDLLEKDEQPSRLYRQPGSPFVVKPGQDGEAPKRPEHYVTAVSLSNYCAYLVMEMLVPDNGLVASKVFEEVRNEARRVVCGCDTKREIYNALISPDKERVDKDSIVGIGAELSVKLASKYSDADELWRRLGNFWTGYLLYLSAWTRAAKHQVHLKGRGELTTHLWALLSHAGFLGPRHGHQVLDPVDEDPQ